MYKNTKKNVILSTHHWWYQNLENLQSKLTFNSFNDCENNDLSNTTNNNTIDNNISNAPYSVAIGDNLSNNISKNPICFTATVHHQTKLLKILNDVNVPNCLYNKIIDWAAEAQLSNIDFADMKKQGKELLIKWKTNTITKTIRAFD